MLLDNDFNTPAASFMKRGFSGLRGLQGTVCRSIICALILVLIFPALCSAQSANANLSNLSLSKGSLSPAFNPDSVNYTAKVNIVKKEHTLYTMGDSITGFGEYQTTLDSLLGNVFTIVNLGIAGDHTTDMANRFPVVVNAVPEYVIILGGINDVLDVDAGGAKAIENNLQTMYTMAHNAGVKVIALTISPSKGYKAWTTYTQAVQDSVNAWMPAAVNVDYLINTFSALQDPANADRLLPAYDSGDHLHPNQAGESKMASMIYSGAKIIPNPTIDQTNTLNTSEVVTPVTSDATATVNVNGTAVASGSSSAAIPLSLGSNTIATKVTAQNGAIKIYNLNVTGIPSTNATLAYVSLSSGGLSLKPAFATATSSYTTRVDHDTTSVRVKPSTMDAAAMVTVNGVAVISGNYSAPIYLAVGNNIITVVVTAQDGSTTSTCTINITRLPVSLANITLSIGHVTPAFSSTINSYAASVTFITTSITVTPTESDKGTTITVDGAAVRSGAASTAISLALGANTITVFVSGPDGSTTYTITETRQPSSNDNLESMVPSAGAITPYFSSGNTSYTSVVPAATTSITITPTTADTNATVTVNGVPTALGVASAPIALALGQNIITTVVTAQDGVTQKTYSLTETRQPSNNANLELMKPNIGTTSPYFSSGNTSYTSSVGYLISSITITPNPADTNATVTVNGIIVAAGTASPAIALAVGVNTIITVVTAQDGTTKKTYALTVTRDAASTDSKLSHLTVSAGTLTPAFATDTTGYRAKVINNTTSLTVTPTAADATATITVNGTTVKSGTPSGTIALNVGANTISITVTAQDGVTATTYTVTVDQIAPSNTGGNQTGIVVHQGISPNGDGIGDFLQIDNITNYPNNDLKIINRDGTLVYETKGYDNVTKVFDGHSSQTGLMLSPGIYYYELDYTDTGISQRKLGFLVLKY